MSGRLKELMAAATRLTREGKLAEAVSLLGQIGPRNAEARAPADRPAPPPLRRPRPAGLHARPSLRERVAVFVPPGARFEAREFVGAAGRRRYKVYIPSTAGSEPMPLVVMLHGCTQSADDFAIGTRMNELAEQQRLVVVYPEQSKSANASKCWNWFNAGDQRRAAGEPSLIAGITAAITGEFAVDARRVYVAGLSAGGAQAAIMGAAYPDLFAAVGVHSGLPVGAASDVPGAFAAMRGGTAAVAPAAGVPMITFHGDADATVHPANAASLGAQARGRRQFDIEVTRGTSIGGIRYEREQHLDARGVPIVEQWTLHGVAHAWSGGNAGGSYVDPKGPDASREMLRFFERHRLGERA